MILFSITFWKDAAGKLTMDFGALNRDGGERRLNVAVSPLRTDILCQRVARAHGWLRTGNKIRERIDLHLRDFDRTQEASGEFIWRAGAVSDIHPYRSPLDEASRRAIPDIPLFDDRRRADEAGSRRALWDQNRELERGNAVRTYEG